MKEGKVTLLNIAEEMGLSKSTVSVALSDKYGVSDEVRSAIVLKAMEMGYDFSRINRRNRVGVVIPNSDFISQSTFWSEVLKGIENSMSRNNLHIDFIVADELNGRLEEIIVTSRAKALVFISANAFQIDIARRACVPVVLLDSTDNVCFDFDHILADNFSGGYLAAKHLYEMGHKRILVLGNPNYSYSFFQRKAGFTYFFERVTDGDRGLVYESGSEQGKLFDIPLGVETLSKRAVTAVMCLNDPIAMQFYPIVTSLGLSVPEDVSFIGFDDDRRLQHAFPTLSTVRISKSKMGEIAALAILDRINHVEKPVETIGVSVTLVIRQSVQNIGGKDEK